MAIDGSVTGEFFYSKCREAILMREKHQHLLAKYTAAFTLDVVSRWEAIITAWNEDCDNPDPYQQRTSRK
jgi:hypothetical protein